MFTNHAEMVKALAAPGADIIKNLTPEMAHNWHMASAAMGECGEAFDVIKKAAIYGKPLDRVNLIEELGDIEFYLEGLRQGTGITREETIQVNLAKLSKRYPDKAFSQKAAIERLDKVETGETESSGVQWDNTRCLKALGVPDDLLECMTFAPCPEDHRHLKYGEEFQKGDIMVRGLGGFESVDTIGKCLGLTGQAFRKLTEEEKRNMNLAERDE